MRIKNAKPTRETATAMPTSLPQETLDPELMSIKLYPIDMHEIPLSAQTATITTGHRYFPNGFLRVRVVMSTGAEDPFASSIELSSVFFCKHFINNHTKPRPIRQRYTIPPTMAVRDWHSTAVMLMGLINHVLDEASQ